MINTQIYEKVLSVCIVPRAEILEEKNLSGRLIFENVLSACVNVLRAAISFLSQKTQWQVGRQCVFCEREKKIQVPLHCN